MVMCHEVGDGSHNRDEESDERRVVETPPDLAETVRSLRAELQSCKADNERLIKEQEKQTEINAVLLQSLSDIQRQLQHEPQPVIWTDDMRREVKVHLRSENMTTLGEVPRRRPNLEAGDTHRQSPLERKLATLKDLLVAERAHILKGKERSGSIPKIMILKSSRNPNHPLSMERLRREKRLKLGCLV
jgi:hypothetical protein